MTLKIISSEKIEYEGTVEMVTLPGVLGQFTVLENHAALIASLASGTVKYREEGGAEQERPILGGVADINANVVSVCLY